MIYAQQETKLHTTSPSTHPPQWNGEKNQM